MEDRFEALPEAFNQMMLLPNMPDFRTSHRLLTKIHQIVTAGGAFLKKEENQRPKGWAVPLDSTRVGRPNRFLVVDRFLDSRCQSRLSYAWWRSPFNEKRFIQTQEMRTAEFFITI